MRIVGGMWRGKAFDAPQGRSTRPTSDRMRESLASMILSAKDLDLDGCSVLDAFAGSGGVGLELLSRGASFCTFCEKDPKAAALVRKNCKALGAQPATWHVVTGDVHRLVGRAQCAGTPFDIVFLDPPYAMPVLEVASLLQELDRAHMLAPSCLVVYERSSDAASLEAGGFSVVRSKRHGTTCVDMLVKGDVQ